MRRWAAVFVDGLAHTAVAIIQIMPPFRLLRHRIGYKFRQAQSAAM